MWGNWGWVVVAWRGGGYTDLCELSRREGYLPCRVNEIINVRYPLSLIKNIFLNPPCHVHRT